jgi:multicomponent K+:H+ antiporter subunit D
MTGWHAHLAIAPIVLPLVTAGMLLLIPEQRRDAKAALALVSLLALFAVAVALVQDADSGPPAVYRLGDWPAPFGIVLVADRLSALMVLLATVLGLAAQLFSLGRWDRAGPRFHTLLQVLVMGVNGAFLTGDLFNLFVFFEVFLAASYGLALHGSGTARVQASLHYIVVNLVASSLFLVGAALIYGVTGTLNLADLALRIPAVPAGERALLEAGAAVLGMAFLIKAGIWPLCFWLPRAYGAASAPAAALFAILTKAGIYVVLRVWLLFFGDAAGASTGFGREWLVVGGALTLAFGAIGVFGAQELPRLAAFSLIASSGTLLAAVGVGHVAVSGAALYYLVASTLGVSALFLLIELVERGRAPGADVLAITAGLPPLPGFVAKLALLDALLATDPIAPLAWVLLALLLFVGIATVVAASRTGVRIFWASERAPPPVRAIEMAPILLLLGCGLALTVLSGPALRYLDDAAQALHAPRVYIDEVLR